MGALWVWIALSCQRAAPGPAATRDPLPSDGPHPTVGETSSETTGETTRETGVDTGTDTGGTKGGDTAMLDTRCPDHDPSGNLYFGDLHIHTSMSFDSYGIGNFRAGPAESYAFARGADLEVANTGETTALREPLDFAAVTDHAEYFGELTACLDDEMLAEDPACSALRAAESSEGSLTNLLGEWLHTFDQENPERLPLCDDVDCEKRARTVWSSIRRVTNAANEPCSFTAFHGYEWSAITADAATLHRNIVFGTDSVPSLPISAYEASTPVDMLSQHAAACDRQPGCAFLSIPHNPNRSNGEMFARAEETLSEDDARLFAEHEPLLEIAQMKGASECLPGLDRYGADDDPLCDFMIGRNSGPLCAAAPDDPDCLELCDDTARGPCVDHTSYVRGVYKESFLHARRLGFQPYAMGLIGSTDDHAGLAGATSEADFVPWLGATQGPGGLVGVWAEENTRAALFGALSAREVYATSGTRLAVRFFAGPDLPPGLCDAEDPVAEARAAGGVPMGSVLAGDGTRMRVLAWASKAAEGVSLDRVQLVRIWMDGFGVPREEVIDLTTPHEGIGVDVDTCEATESGADTLCAVWEDPLGARESSLMYLRVLEMPSCGIDAYEYLADSGCSIVEDDLIAERAWTSPIWTEVSKP